MKLEVNGIVETVEKGSKVHPATWRKYFIIRNGQRVSELTLPEPLLKGRTFNVSGQTIRTFE